VESRPHGIPEDSDAGRDAAREVVDRSATREEGFHPPVVAAAVAPTATIMPVEEQMSNTLGEDQEAAVDRRGEEAVGKEEDELEEGEIREVDASRISPHADLEDLASQFGSLGMAASAQTNQQPQREPEPAHSHDPTAGLIEQLGGMGIESSQPQEQEPAGEEEGEGEALFFFDTTGTRGAALEAEEQEDERAESESTGDDGAEEDEVDDEDHRHDHDHHQQASDDDDAESAVGNPDEEIAQIGERWKNTVGLIEKAVRPLLPSPLLPEHSTNTGNSVQRD
jgi:hypothetical protein